MEAVENTTMARELVPPSPDAIAQFAIDHRPRLMVIVDAEEEFDWGANFSREATQTRSIRHQRLAHRILDQFGVVPTYAIDYPVASQSSSHRPLREFLDAERCVIAAHLHPWVNPPFGEEVNEHNSYPGNLPRHLEREKLARLKGRLEKSFGVSPIIYRAGRYGFGIHTAEILNELGFKVDCSVLPHWRVNISEGPDYRKFPESPYWFGPERQLLEFPTTVGVVGSLQERTDFAYDLVGGRLGSRLKLPGVLSRLGLAERIQLTPEGTSLEEAKRLTNTLIKRGHRIFLLSYHSTSLLPGSNPYVRNKEELSCFLQWLQQYLEFFFYEINGVASTPLELHASAVRSEVGSAAAWGADGSATVAISGAPSATRRIWREPKCLLVASTFPPLVGGTCVVYDNLCRYSRGAVIPLVPYVDFRTGEPIRGARDHDQNSPYKIYRRRLLRPQHQTSASWIVRLARATVSDLPLLLRVLISILRIILRERIKILCVGELTYCGWLVAPCKYLFGLKTILYVHGEEITTVAPGLAERLKFKWLHMADKVVSVSTFTARAMMERAHLPPEKIQVITNGVDTDIFRPTQPRHDLIERYALAGTRVLLSVGRLVERKGIDHVLRSLPEVLARHPRVRYLVVGDGEFRPDLERLAESLGITDHVVFTGEVPPNQLVAHYALGEVFIQPNRQLADGDTEGFGLVFLEANACGKPVIAGIDGGAPDAVTNGENGLLVDGRNIGAIAQAIDNLLSDTELYRKLQVGGLARAGASTWRSRVSEFRALCDSLLTGYTTSGHPVDKTVVLEHRP